MNTNFNKENYEGLITLIKSNRYAMLERDRRYKKDYPNFHKFLVDHSCLLRLLLDIAQHNIDHTSYSGDTLYTYNIWEYIRDDNIWVEKDMATVYDKLDALERVGIIEKVSNCNYIIYRIDLSTVIKAEEILGGKINYDEN